MVETAAAQPADPQSTWRVSAPHVRKAIAFVKTREKRGMVTNADDLVEWDLAHGRRLFDWDNASAAADWRLHQARLFLNRFRAMFDGMRVRAFIHISEDEQAGIDESGYVTVEGIAAHPGMRAQVIDDIVRRMKMLASELAMWQLEAGEQAAIFQQLADAMNGKRKAGKAA